MAGFTPTTAPGARRTCGRAIRLFWRMRASSSLASPSPKASTACRETESMWRPCSNGYRIARGSGAEASTGERAINPFEADIVRGIFTDFAAGKSPRAIAIKLNRRAVSGPSGKPWGASTIYGNWRRSTGILNNELYVGKLVWNRQRFVKDPERGRRQARPNPESDWVVEEVPALRIVDDALWTQVKSRQTSVRRALIGDKPVARSEDARRPRYLFSGLHTCGVCCGGGYTMVGAITAAPTYAIAAPATTA